MKKNIFAAAASVLFAVTIFFTHAACAQMNTSLYINEIEYNKSGHIEIKFKDNTVNGFVIHWSNREIFSVFDKDGRKIPSEIFDTGNDWLRIHVPNIVEGEIYTFELKRVSYQARDDIEYTGFFSAIPNWKIEYREPPRFRKQIMDANASAKDIIVRRLDYDRGGRLKVGFAGLPGKKISIEWNGKEKVIVMDETGIVYEARIEEYEKNEMEVHISNVVENMNYTIEIANVTYNNESLSFKLAFTAKDSWRYRPPRPAAGK